MTASARITSRRGKANYIVQKGGAYYYRRMVPLALRGAYNRREIWDPLSERTPAGRLAESMALARRDDLDFRKMAALLEGRVPEIRATALAYNWPQPSSELPPPIWHNGVVQRLPHLVVTTDPAVRRDAEQAGVLVMTWEEHELQEQRANFDAQTREAPTLDQRRDAQRMVLGITSEIEAVRAAESSDWILNTMERWFAYKKQRPETARKHRQYIEEFIRFVGGDCPLSKVEELTVSGFMHDILTRTMSDGRRLSATSAAKRLVTLKAFFRWAKRHARGLAVNPAADLDPPTDDRSPGERSFMPLAPADCVTLLTESTKFWTTRRQIGHPSRPYDLQVALRLLMATGARPNEICQLRRADVNLERRCITITNFATHDGFAPRKVKNPWSNRIVPIHSAVWAVVVSHVERSDHLLLFPSFAPTRSEGYYSDVLSGEWTDNLRALVQFDHPKKVLDSLRHTFAVEADRVEIPEPIKNELMGHTRGKNRNATRYVINADSVDLGRLERFRSYVEKMNFPALKSAPCLAPVRGAPA